LGTLLRFYLARLNAKFSTFPIGTFVVNMLGSGILGALYVAKNSTSVSLLTCSSIAGLSDGFCGSLTTISTFAVELRTLPRHRAYWYGATSVVVAQVILVLAIGVYAWSQGLGSAGCVAD
ncbi:putative fluoride ion transporter CrcB, partial [Blyttiomyces helicus]